ncbi:MAG TPA: sialidase family protein [bacterium]
MRSGSLPLLLIILVVPVLITLAPSNATGQAGAQAVPGRTAMMAAGTVYRPQFSATPPAVSSAQLAAAEAQMRLSDRGWAARPGPRILSPAAPLPPGADVEPSRAIATPPNTFTVFKSQVVNGAPAAYTANVNSPAAAQAGMFVWLTHNRYAARSINGGSNWTYVSPYADFPAFCCNQDAIYDRRRDVFIWSRQGNYSTLTHQNQIKISVSVDNGATWCGYVLTPKNVNTLWVESYFDSPQIALSNNYLYWTANLFDNSGPFPVFSRMVLFRWPLDAMRTCTIGFSYSWWSKPDGWSWAPVQGADTTMYIGDNYATGSNTDFYLAVQPESSTVLTGYIKTIPNFTFTNHNAHCPVLAFGYRNPCARADQRITAGWIGRRYTGTTVDGTIGFFWNVAEGGGYPYPYVEAALYSQSTLARIGRPAIASQYGAWFYAAAAPNVSGHVGLSLFYFISNDEPRWYAGISDDYSGMGPIPPFPLDIVRLATSLDPPATDEWGDYVRVRPFNPSGTLWVATGFTSDARSNYPISVPRFAIFGRARDQRSYNRWFNK